MVSISAMPIAPPRLRIRLNRPLASGMPALGDDARAPGASAAGGRTSPRSRAPPAARTSASKSVAPVWKQLIARPTPNSEKAERRQIARVEALLQRDRDRRGDELRDAGDQHDHADLEARRGPAQRRETPASGRPSRTGRCPSTKLSRQPSAKLRSRKVRRSTSGQGARSVRRDEGERRRQGSAPAGRPPAATSSCAAAPP